MVWKQHIITKLRNEKRGMVEILYSSIEGNANATSRTSSLFFILESKRYPFKCYDLVKYRNLKKIVEVKIY